MTSAPPSTDPVTEPAPAATRRRRGLIARLSIQSKVMVMLLVCSIASVTVIGLVEYVSARNAMQRSTYSRLTELRSAQKRAIETLFSDLRNSTVMFARGYVAADAVQAFGAGFTELQRASIDPAQHQAVVDYYENEVIKPTEAATGTRIDLDAVLPASAAQEYLEAHYSVAGAARGDDAGDGSAWTAANIRFNPYFREIVTRFQFQDALLIDPAGNVVYSYDKGPDLGTNILTGPYRESNLRPAYQKALAANAVDYVWITDFAPYQPQRDRPTAWLVAPIRVKDKALGVLALPVPIARINAIMTGDRHWEQAGVGTTTETYLAGPDNLMRSDSRLFLEDPQAYRRAAVAAGTPGAVVDRALRLGSTVLVQPVTGAGLQAAQRGETGIATDTGYLGNRELQAHSELTVPDSDLHWTILATKDTAEAFARITAFTKTIVLTTTGLIFVICLVAALLARVFVGPIRRLSDGTRRISAGDYDVTIDVTTRDEIGELTGAFNEMSRSLRLKQRQLDDQRAENDRLLLSLMPAELARRHRDDEAVIAERHRDVTVVYAEITGFDEIDPAVPAVELVGSVDELLRQFDAAAAASGVEPVRTLHTGYLAGCGLATPRLDSAHRGVEFAQELGRIVDRFNSRTGATLRLRAGVTSGPVVSGLVGSSRTVYDMWGVAVVQAYRMYQGPAEPGIYVSGAVRDVLDGGFEFTAADAVAGVAQPIWRLDG